MWAHSHPGYISSLRDNSISFGCIWGDLCFLFLEQTGSFYKMPDNSRTVIWQTAPLHENQHIACLSAFTTLWNSAVCQSINYPMPILSQTGIYVLTVARHCVKYPSSKLKRRNSRNYRLAICNIIPGQNKFHIKVQNR